jgi:hypothetical protein
MKTKPRAPRAMPILAPRERPEDEEEDLAGLDVTDMSVAVGALEIGVVTVVAYEVDMTEVDPESEPDIAAVDVGGGMPGCVRISLVAVINKVVVGGVPNEETTDATDEIAAPALVGMGGMACLFPGSVDVGSTDDDALGSNAKNGLYDLQLDVSLVLKQKKKALPVVIPY